MSCKGSCKCNMKQIMYKLNEIEEQIKVLTEEYDKLNREIYDGNNKIGHWYDIEYRDY